MATRPLSASTNFQDMGMTPEDRLKRMESMANDFTVDRNQPIRRYLFNIKQLSDINRVFCYFDLIISMASTKGSDIFVGF